MSKRIKPTLRRNGRMMFPVRVAFTVGRDELVAIGMPLALDGERLPGTRTKWLQLLQDRLREFGQWGPSLDVSNWTEWDIQEAESMVNSKISSIFPDLTPPIAATEAR